MKCWLVIFCLFILMFFSQGCLSQIASFEAYTKGWVGRPLSELKKVISRPESYPSRIGSREKTYTLDNGNSVYVEPSGRDCFIHWEVNPEGIIIGYKTVGNRCY